MSDDKCPMCDGQKAIYSLERTRYEVCIVCNGTGKRPVERSQAALRRSARVQRVKRKR